MKDFIKEFERLYNSIKKYYIEISTGLLTNRLLRSGITSEDRQQSLFQKWSTLDPKTFYSIPF